MPMPNEHADGYDPNDPHNYDSCRSYNPGEVLPDYVEDALYDAFSVITIAAAQNPQDLCSGFMIVKAKSARSMLTWARENVLIGRGI